MTRTPWVATGCAVLLLAAAAARMQYDGVLLEPFVPYSDQTFQAHLVQRDLDPGLYPRDVSVQAIDAFWPSPYFHAIAVASGWFGSLERTWMVLTLAFTAVFLTGILWLGRDLFDSWAVGFVAALGTALVPRDTFVAEWAVMPLIPRYATLACSPWLLLWLRHAGRGGRGALPFLAAGLMALAHSLSALHLALVMGVALLLGAAGPVTVRRLGWAASGAALGALPAFLVLNTSDLQSVSPEELANTSFYYLFWPLLYKGTEVAVNLAMLAGAVLVGAWWLRRQGPVWRGGGGRFLRRLMAATFLLASLHLVVASTGVGLALSPLRITKYWYLILLLGCAAVGVGLLRRAGLSARLVGVAVLATALLPIPERAFQVAWARIHPFGRRMNESLAARPAIFKPDLNLAGRNAEVRAFGEALQEVIPVDGLVLAPPRGGSTLRLYSQRSFYVLGEDSVVVLYNRENLTAFTRRIERAVEAYTSGHAEQVLALAHQAGCEWVLLPEEWPTDREVRARGAGLVLVEA